MFSHFFTSRMSSPSPRGTVQLNFDVLESRIAPAIRLDLVALHEFGHALGLAHHNSSSSIMYRYYNANYNVANLANDPAVVARKDGYNQLLELFSDAKVAANSTSWKDSLDSTPGDGTVNVSYSYMPDGVSMDSGTNVRNASWDATFAEALSRWASVSTGNLSFSEVADDGVAFNGGSGVQNGPRGDIRIGFHYFDGPNRVLAHAYYPPPNGNTASGDAHFDSSEDWVLAGGISTGPTGGGGKGGGGNLGSGHDHGHSDPSSDASEAALLTIVEQTRSFELQRQFVAFTVPIAQVQRSVVAQAGPNASGTASISAFATGWLVSETREAAPAPQAGENQNAPEAPAPLQVPRSDTSPVGIQLEDFTTPAPVFAPEAQPADTAAQPEAGWWSPAPDVQTQEQDRQYSPGIVAAVLVVLGAGCTLSSKGNEVERRERKQVV